MKLFIGNLNFDTMESDITTLFSSVGDIVTVKLIKDRDTGRSRGFAFVEYETSKNASDAISRFNGYTLDGNQLKVNEAQEKRERSNSRRW